MKRKFIGCLFMIIMIFLSGCSAKESNEMNENMKDKSDIESQEIIKEEKTDDEIEDVSLQLTTEMENLKQDAENNDTIRQLDELLTKNSKIGTPKDFTLYYSGIFGENTNTKTTQLVFLAINRTGRSLKNISFKLTMKKDDEVIFEKKPVFLKESDFGTLDNNKAFPVILDAEDSKEEIIKEITTDNYSMNIDEFGID